MQPFYNLALQAIDMHPWHQGGLPQFFHNAE